MNIVDEYLSGRRANLRAWQIGALTVLIPLEARLANSRQGRRDVPSDEPTGASARLGAFVGMAKSSVDKVKALIAAEAVGLLNDVKDGTITLTAAHNQLKKRKNKTHEDSYGS